MFLINSYPCTIFTLLICTQYRALLQTKKLFNPRKTVAQLKLNEENRLYFYTLFYHLYSKNFYLPLVFILSCVDENNRFQEKCNLNNSEDQILFPFLKHIICIICNSHDHKKVKSYQKWHRTNNMLSEGGRGGVSPLGFTCYWGFHEKGISATCVH